MKFKSIVFSITVQILFVGVLFANGPYNHFGEKRQSFFVRGNEILHVEIKVTGNFNKHELVIRKLDAESMSVIAENSYTNLPGFYQYEKIIQWKGKYYVFYSAADGKVKTQSLMCREINFDQATLSEKGKSIVSTTERIEGIYNKIMVGQSSQQWGGSNLEIPQINRTKEAKNGQGDFVKGPIMPSGIGKPLPALQVNPFVFSFSPDSSRLLISFRFFSKKVSLFKYYDRYGMYEIRPDLSQEDHRKVSLNASGFQIEPVSWAVNNQGDKYVLLRRKNKAVEGSWTDVSSGGSEDTAFLAYHLELLSYKSGVPDSLVKRFSLKHYDISEMELIFNKEGQLMGVGYFKNNKSTIRGIAAFVVNDFVSDGTIQWFDFSKKKLLDYHSETQAGKLSKWYEDGDLGFGNLRLRKVLIDNTGNLVLVGERFYVVDNYMRIAPELANSAENLKYTYGEIVVSSLDKSLSPEWTTVIPKYQRVAAWPFRLSNYLVQKDNELRLFTYDRKENINLPKDQSPTVYNGVGNTNLVLSKINLDDGTLTQRNIYSAEQIKAEKTKYSGINSLFLIDDNRLGRRYRKGQNSFYHQIQLN